LTEIDATLWKSIKEFYFMCVCVCVCKRGGEGEKESVETPINAT
jgi:hypothetical protein